MELNNYGVLELSNEESKTIEGGGFMLALILGFFVGAFFAYISTDPFEEES
jgi:hypothetical protein